MEGPALHFFRRGKPEPEIAIGRFIEPVGTGRHDEGMADNVQKTGFGEVFQQKGEHDRVGVLHGLFVPHPTQIRFLLGGQPGGAFFHQFPLRGQVVLQRRGFAPEQVTGQCQGGLQAAVGIPLVRRIRPALMELKQNPGNVRFVGNEDLRMQVQDSDQLGGAGPFVPNDEERTRHALRVLNARFPAKAQLHSGHF
jgi:hypothetical protein